MKRIEITAESGNSTLPVVLTVIDNVSVEDIQSECSSAYMAWMDLSESDDYFEIPFEDYLVRCLMDVGIVVYICEVKRNA